MKKIGRNDPCPCGSGKKFKKCCESKMLGGRFMATKIENSQAVLPKKMSQLTGLFQTKVSEIVKPSDTMRSLKPSSPPEGKPSEDDISTENPNKEIES
jgi:hypothetical protein